MADVNPRVMEMVEAELKENPGATTEELYEKAKKIDKGIGKLSNRQFNARYPLQVKRRQSGGRRRARGRRRSRQANANASDRNAIRAVLLDFAKDVAAAEQKADVVAVIGNVDRYVDRVAKAAGKR